MLADRALEVAKHPPLAAKQPPPAAKQPLSAKLSNAKPAVKSSATPAPAPADEAAILRAAYEGVRPLGAAASNHRMPIVPEIRRTVVSEEAEVLAALLAVVVLVSFSCLATFLLAGRLSRMLGHTGNIVLSRLLGDLLLRALGISLPAFRIAGGLLLFAIAFEMVLGVRMRREGQAAEEAVEEHVRNIAAFPLAIPLMAGPGAITATVLLAGRAYGQMLLVGLLLAVVVFVSLSCLATFLLAGRLSRMLGHTGNIVLSRLLGVLLAALAVQYVVDGIRAVLAG